MAELWEGWTLTTCRAAGLGITHILLRQGPKTQVYPWRSSWDRTGVYTLNWAMVQKEALLHSLLAASDSKGESALTTKVSFQRWKAGGPLGRIKLAAYKKFKQTWKPFCSNILSNEVILLENFQPVTVPISVQVEEMLSSGLWLPFNAGAFWRSGEWYHCDIDGLMLEGRNVSTKLKMLRSIKERLLCFKSSINCNIMN